MTECYVCYEPCTDPAPCKCKTLYVHPSCILIMQLYGQRECGVCKTPYSTENSMEFMEEEIEAPVSHLPPCCCVCIPTPCRSMYYVSEYDEFLDIFRYVFIGILVMTFVHFISSPDFLNFSEDWPALVIIGFLLIIIGSLVAQRLKMQQRSVHPHIHRDTGDP